MDVQQMLWGKMWSSYTSTPWSTIRQYEKVLERGVTPGTSPSLIQCRPSALSWHADQRIRPRRRHRVKSRLEKGKGMQAR
ncbi:hypothetical protein CgunFtcFv8_024546 [Champsocephalus gunnari]|nr:hypothetical protein CgunFtcFv8_024546 [Champsocephalus gunnari]